MKFHRRICKRPDALRKEIGRLCRALDARGARLNVLTTVRVPDALRRMTLNDVSVGFRYAVAIMFCS
jgi:hypothetical protein